jgi:hypothetical protein
MSSGALMIEVVQIPPGLNPMVSDIPQRLA